MVKGGNNARISGCVGMDAYESDYHLLRLGVSAVLVLGRERVIVM